MSAPIDEELVRLVRFGVFLPLHAPCSLRYFLEKILGFSDSYIERRIQTILLDGLAADGLDCARISVRSRLALSAAMPGLAGATLRCGGALQNLRRDISLKTCDETDTNKIEPFWVELRLFNDIAAEQALTLFSRGFAVSSAALPPALRALTRPLPETAPPPPEGMKLLLLQK